jgi:uncharacterized protein (TIGR03083 family)
MMTPPILTAHLFPEVSARLVELLRALSADDWRRPTVSSRRTVHDIAAHLLDGSLRRLSFQRDGYRPDDPRTRPAVEERLVDFLNRLNDEWETAARRLSPRVLVDMLERADAELASLFAGLDPHGAAIFPVAWAGEERSENWFDVARDYTEKWHHTAQIFDAVGHPSTIYTPRLMRPCLATFMRALPFAYRDVAAPDATSLVVEITGAAGGRWQLVRSSCGWRLHSEGGASGSVAATVTLDADTAWRLFTKRRTIDAARREFPDVVIEGDAKLGEPVLTMVSVMA